MPLIEQFSTDKNAQLAIWMVTETPEELLLALQQEGVYAEAPYFKNPKRLSDWLSARLLLSKLGVKQMIRYDAAGKPHLEGAPPSHISISHSGNYVATMVHPKVSCGVDIEHQGDRILRVSHKFIGTEEYNWVHNGEGDKLLKMYQIWGAKECAFKIYGLGKIDFRRELIVEVPENNSRQTKVHLLRGEDRLTYTVFFKFLDGYVLTYGNET